MYIIRTLKLKKYLESKGFKVEGTMPNRDIPKFIVWLFQDGKELREAIQEYSKK
ncbi:DUF5659 domain-containing protein [Clostridium sartagoforme]|uniref:DUF5659 domain-containing protein n=1 Tax=Clostridium sartagoforme TaxID=84031 RepID=UPI0003A7FFFB|nr:DUF5659 domain-containing protein [Clostridium sartagoforme]